MWSIGANGQDEGGSGDDINNWTPMTADGTSEIQGIRLAPSAAANSFMQQRSPSYDLHRLNRGFSLFELLIVLAVIVSVTAMAAPSLMDRLQNGRVQDAAEGVREVLANTPQVCDRFGR